MSKTSIYLLVLLIAFSCNEKQDIKEGQKYKKISGVFPHLAYYNEEGECGTGAVVPWAGKLWVVTYGQHFPFGSTDKLYEISDNYDVVIRDESIGGTPANRMIHKESQQLFIGPYAIDSVGKVRAIPYEKMPGRHTGNARHLTDPENLIYYATMEEGFYEVDVHTLEVNQLYVDGNVVRKEGNAAQFSPLLPGAHGKGVFTGQGVMVYSNNGEDVPEATKYFDIEAGSLSEWDGENWEIVRRNQFVEVTGPGGIYGNSSPETDPIWATGWDHRSILVGVRDKGSWSFYRLPKASHSYDGAHGWNTEWPRIRDIGSEGNPDFLMTMHGMFWNFPGSFSNSNTAGIRPRSSYLKVVGDYTRWNNQLVFGTDDSAQKEFLNKRKVKGGIEGPGQSNSNLWFTDLSKPDNLGPNTAEGALYISESIIGNVPSDQFLFAGWDQRMVWVLNEGAKPVTFTFEVDQKGDGNWSELNKIEVGPGETGQLNFDSSDKGEWVRVTSDKNTTGTIQFTYTDQSRFPNQMDTMFNGIAEVGSDTYLGGLLYGLGNNRRALGVSAGTWNNANFEESGYYELNGEMDLVKKDDPEMLQFINEKFAIPKEVLTVEESSVLIIDDKGRRWRLPLGDSKFDEPTRGGSLRIAREVATERDLMNLHGTFYELPAENADGFAKVRPVASHSFKIHDYASFRGMLVMTGLEIGISESEHIIVSNDGKAAVWAGVIDDLWELGKPVGHGGPWHNTQVVPNEPSDPYLIGFYDKKILELSHDSNEEVIFTLEVEPVGHGPWMKYNEISVPANKTIEFDFPSSFQARWIRFKSSKSCTATTTLTYR